MTRQGTVRHRLQDRRDDLYETPTEATHALLACESLPPLVWEPAPGRGAISRVLESPGRIRVVASDLVAWPGADPGITPRVDFLLERSAPAGVTCLVTNPPYKLADRFIRHGLQLVDTVIVLLRLVALEGTGRSDIVDHLRRVHVGIERLPMMHRDGWNGSRLSTGTAPFAWFVFARMPRPQGEPIALTRISWRNGTEVKR